MIWGDHDRIVAPGRLGAVLASLPSEVVRGNHGWLATEPRTGAP